MDLPLDPAIVPSPSSAQRVSYFHQPIPTNPYVFTANASTNRSNHQRTLIHEDSQAVRSLKERRLISACFKYPSLPVAFLLSSLFMSRTFAILLIRYVVCVLINKVVFAALFLGG